MGGSAPAPGPRRVLSTRRLVLTPVSPDDEVELLTLFREPAVRRYLLDDLLVDAAWVAAEVAASGERFDTGSAGLWAIRDGAGGESILGFAGFRPFFDPPELQLLYGLYPDAWGRGYATEAASAVLGHAFTVLGFSLVTAATDVPNARSVGVDKQGPAVAGAPWGHTIVHDGERTCPARDFQGQRIGRRA